MSFILQYRSNRSVPVPVPVQRLFQCSVPVQSHRKLRSVGPGAENDRSWTGTGTVQHCFNIHGTSICLSSFFIHSFVLITLAFRHCLRRATMFYSCYYFLLFSCRYCLFRLTSSVLPLSAFLSYSSSRFVLLMNSAVCFIICGWPSNLSIFSLPFPMSFIIFFLCSLYFRHSNR